MKFSDISPPLSELAQRQRDRQRSAATAEVPFIEVNGRRALTRQIVEERPELADFVRRFANCFEEEPHSDVMLFIEGNQLRKWPAPRLLPPARSCLRCGAPLTHEGLLYCDGDCVRYA